MFACLVLALPLSVGCRGRLASMAYEDGGDVPSVDAGIGPSVDAHVPGADAQTPPPVDAGGAPGVDAGPPPPPGPTPLAAGVTIDQVALFQGVKVVLAEGGAAVAASDRNAPIVGGRPGRFRVYVSGADRSLTAEVRVTRGGETRAFTDTRVLSGPSVDADPRSTFEIDVPGEWIVAGADWSVAITEPGGALTPDGVADGARFPSTGGSDALEAIDDPWGFRILLVPFSWESDGSGRLPDTSPEQVELLREHFGTLFPFASVQIEVHAPLAWTGGLNWRGNVDFGDVNARLVSLRAEESAPDDLYYYGLLAPATSRSAYCGGSCVTGQSFVVSDPADARIRVGSGLGFAGTATAGTLQHELGHIQGRSHAPCGTSTGVDRSYPYAGGDIGVWGWDRLEDVYHPPTAPDVMGYCSDRWISDYTYRGLFERHLAIHRVTTTASRGWAPREPLQFVRVDADGTPHHLRDVTLALPRGGRTRVHWIGGDGRSLGWADAARVDQTHADDELYLLPVAPEGAVAFEVAGGELTRLPAARATAPR